MTFLELSFPRPTYISVSTPIVSDLISVKYIIPHDFIIDRDEARGLFSNVHDMCDDMIALCQSIGEPAYLMQDPHVILRADRHISVESERKESKDDANIEARFENEKVRTDLDQGCQAARPSNH